MNKISSRQLYFFLACVAPVGKLIIMPAQLVYYSKNDLLIPTAVNLLIQAGAIFLVMLLSRSEKSVFELVEYTFGRIGKIIFSCLFALFFLFAAFLPLLEQKLLVQSVFYDTLPSLIAFAPFFLFSAYLCAKPLSACGRVWDILMPVTIVGFFGLMIFSVGDADFGALLPVGASGGTGLVNGFTHTMSWFFDSALLLLFMGNFRYRKGMAWKSSLCYLIGGLAVLLFLAVFYGIFSDIALRQTFAFAKISKYFSAITVLGRVDYIFICLLALAMAFYCVLPLRSAAACLEVAFQGRGKPAYYSIGVNAVMVALSVLLDLSFQTVRDTVSGTLFWVFPVFCVALPALCLLLRRSPREAKVL